VIALLLAPLPALAGMCYQASFSQPNRTHVVVKNAAADAGVLVSAYAYAAAGPKFSSSWCVPPHRSSIREIDDMIVNFKFEVGEPDCTHNVRFERDLAGGNPNIGGTLNCTATVTGRRPTYNVQR
jgi:hypothetical protein